jgi:hypothetical protein
MHPGQLPRYRIDEPLVRFGTHRDGLGEAGCKLQYRQILLSPVVDLLHDPIREQFQSLVRVLAAALGDTGTLKLSEGGQGQQRHEQKGQQQLYEDADASGTPVGGFTPLVGGPPALVDQLPRRLDEHKVDGDGQ